MNIKKLFISNKPLFFLILSISVFIVFYFYKNFKRSDYETFEDCVFLELKSFNSNQNQSYVENYCNKLIIQKQEKLRLAEEERLRKEAEKQEKLRLAEEERLRKEAEKQEKLRLAEEERLRKEAEKIQIDKKVEVTETTKEDKKVEVTETTKEDKKVEVTETTKEDKKVEVTETTKEDKKSDYEYWVYDYSYDSDSKKMSGEMKFTSISKSFPLIENVYFDGNSLIKDRGIKNDKDILNIDMNNRQIHEIAPYLNYNLNLKNLEKIKLTTNVKYNSFFYDDTWLFNVKKLESNNFSINSKNYQTIKFYIEGARRTFPGNCTGNMVGVVKAEITFIPEIKRIVTSKADYLSCKFGGTEQILFTEKFLLKDYFQFSD